MSEDSSQPAKPPLRGASPASRARRSLLLGALAFAATPAAAIIHAEPGVLRPPVAVPALRLTLDDGRVASLPSLLEGRVTALQFVLTGCSAVCPLLGAIFAAAQAQLAACDDVQWLSISLDPLGDTPQRLHHWLAQFGAGPRWRAGVPAADDPLASQAMQRLGAGQPADDAHSGAVLIVDRTATAVYRTESLPDPEGLCRALRAIAGSGRCAAGS